MKLTLKSLWDKNNIIGSMLLITSALVILTGLREMPLLVTITALLLGVLFEIIKPFNLQDVKKDKLLTLFSILLGAAFTIGGKINFDTVGFFNPFSIFDLIVLISWFIVLFPISLESYRILSKGTFVKEKNLKPYSFIKIWFVIIISWIGYYILFSPGLITYDSINSIAQIMGDIPFSDHHPILFTKLLGIFVLIGHSLYNINLGVILFVLFQILVLSLILTLLILKIQSLTNNKKITIFCLLFFSINPISAFFAFAVWKDILFAGIVTLFTIKLYDFIKNNYKTSKLEFCGLLFLFFLIPFLRNNGIYIITTVFVGLSFMIINKNQYKKWLLFFITLLTVLIIQGPVYSNIFEVKEGNFAESLSIPLQQIAYTVDNDFESINSKDKKIITTILPKYRWISNYSPTVVDPIKQSKSFNNEFLNNNKKEFIITWWDILKTHPASFTKAYLLHSINYYYPLTDYIENENLKRFSMNTPFVMENNYNIAPQGILSSRPDYQLTLFQIIQKAITHRTPLNIFYNIALIFWFTIFGIVLLVKKKKYNLIIIFLPSLANYFTLLIASPISTEFRYILPAHFIMPFLIAILLKEIKEN